MCPLKEESSIEGSSVDKSCELCRPKKKRMIVKVRKTVERESLVVLDLHIRISIGNHTLSSAIRIKFERVSFKQRENCTSP